MKTDVIREAAHVLLARPIRSALSLVSIFVGLLSLLILLAIHAGARREADDLTRLGAQVFLITPAFDSATSRIGTLNRDHLRALENEPLISSVLPRLQMDKEARSRLRTARVTLFGLDDRFTVIYRLRVQQGRMFLPQETRRKSNVCLLTEQGRDKLFPLGSSPGDVVNIDGETFTVIGVLQWPPAATQRAFLAQTPDILMPLSHFLIGNAAGSFSLLEVRAELEKNAVAVEQAVLRNLTHGDRSREALYSVESYQRFIQGGRAALTRALRSLLIMAMISLLVGAIGIANVMLVSVTERIREIGVRMALGARREDIMAQFLIEGSVLTTAGGLLALFAALAIQSLLPLLAKKPLILHFSLPTVAGCLLLSCLIGFLASIYPASYAASLTPAEALRYE